MSDRYADLVGSGAGAALARRLGLPRPARLRRWQPDQDLLAGPLCVVAADDGHLVAPVIAQLSRDGDATTLDPGSESDPADGRIGALVLLAAGISTVADLETVRGLLAPALRRMAPSGRIIVVGSSPATAGDDVAVVGERAAVHQGLEGLVRSVAKELRAGATANLVRLPADPAVLGDADSAAAALSSTLRFLVSARSAYVSGQVIELARPVSDSASGAGSDDHRRVAVVTGAARGIGAAIAATLAGNGLHVVCVDIPAQGEALARTANSVGGTALQLDVTAEQAPHLLRDHLTQRHGRLDVLVHNAGITRDRLLVNTDADRWGSVLEVNLASQLRIDDALLAADGLLAPGSRLIGVSSTSGLAGNRGQANYATSKAGVAGRVRALAAPLASRGITVNAVAPGFIETGMTGRIPFATREVARRINSLAQAGLPVDVAETVGWLASPDSDAVTGQVVRVCGQSWLGA